MITDCFDDKTEPVISLRDFYGEQKHLVETCLILFSQKIYQHLLDTFPSEKIGLIGACNGNIPIYRMNYKGKDIAFYLSGIGSALLMLAGAMFIMSRINPERFVWVLSATVVLIAELVTAAKLLKPEVRQKGKEQVKEKARDSVLQLLSRLQAEQAQNKPAAQPRTQEGHSEI